MKKTYVVIGLIFALLVQVAIMLGGYVVAAAPLMYGEEVKLKVLPVDPRSLFRGNYVRLGYDISSVTSERLGDTQIRQGEKVFVHIAPNEQGLYEYVDVGLTPPQNGVYLRGRVRHVAQNSREHTLGIRYGIEAYFLPKEAALELERSLGDGAVVSLMIGKKGRAAIKEVHAGS